MGNGRSQWKVKGKGWGRVGNGKKNLELGTYEKDFKRKNEM